MSEKVIIDGDLLEVKNVQLDDEGQYFCTATNQGGTVSSRSVLYVRGTVIGENVFFKSEEKFNEGAETIYIGLLSLRKVYKMSLVRYYAVSLCF